MTWLREFASRFAALIRKRGLEREMNEELRSHLEMLIEENVRRGMPREEARYAALRSFGGVDQTKETYRDQRGILMFETLAQDLRYGVRMLVKNPGFTAVAALTLALGIAVNSTIFSLVSAVLFRRPPVSDPGRVVMALATNKAVGWTGGLNSASAPEFISWRAQNSVFQDIAAADAWANASLTGQGEPQRVSSMRVSPGYFSVLGVPAALGRAFISGEDQPGADHVVILSYGLWQQRFGADAKLIGRTVSLNGEPYIVIGVMPASFRLSSFRAEIWTPLVLSAAQLTPAARTNHFLFLFARLKPGVSVEQARSQVATFAQRAQHDYPDTDKDWGATVLPLQEYMIRDQNVRPALVMLMSTVFFVLLIACANIAGLLLARATARAKEMAIRVALGAPRRRVIRQLLTESLLIALLGGLLGLLLSYWGVDVLRAALSFNDVVKSFDLSIDGRVVAFTALVSMLAALLFGLAPSFQASKADLHTALKSDSRAGSAGPSRRRLRGVLVSAEVALAFVLLTGAGLMIKGILESMRRSLGFNPQHVLSVEVSLSGARYLEAPKQLAFFRNVIGRLQVIPGVQSAGAATSLAATGAERIPFRIDGQAPAAQGERPQTRHYVISPDYLRTMDISLVRGRGFTDSDGASGPAVVLVNETFARRFLTDQEPLGKRISVGPGTDGKPEWRDIVGVVGNVADWPDQSGSEPQVYESYLQRPSDTMTFAVRASSDLSALAPALRRAVWAVDADQPIGKVNMLRRLLDDETAGDHVMGEMLGIFALLALALSAVGIYGIVAYGVGQRTREIGIRMALGARKSEVLRLVLRDGMKLTLMGTVVGLALALPVPRVFESAFFDFHVHATWLYLVIPALISLVALLACYIPARRAMKVDPIVALRYE